MEKKSRQQQNNKRLGTALISRLFFSFCLLVESRKVCNIFLRKVFRPPSAVRNRSERETEIKKNKRDKSFASGFECHYRQLFCDNYNLCWVATEGWLNDLALLLVERFILLIRIVFFAGALMWVAESFILPTITNKTLNIENIYWFYRHSLFWLNISFCNCLLNHGFGVKTQLNSFKIFNYAKRIARPYSVSYCIGIR